MLALMMILAADPEPPLPYKVALAKKDDTFSAKSEKGRTTWTISSKSGIGSAAVSGELPLKILLRFPGLRAMEQFTLEIGGNKVAMKAGGGYQGAGSKGNSFGAITEVKKDGVEVEITLDQPKKEMKLSWINEFRR